MLSKLRNWFFTFNKHWVNWIKSFNFFHVNNFLGRKSKKKLREKFPRCDRGIFHEFKEFPRIKFNASKFSNLINLKLFNCPENTIFISCSLENFFHHWTQNFLTDIYPLNPFFLARNHNRFPINFYFTSPFSLALYHSFHHWSKLNK